MRNFVVTLTGALLLLFASPALATPASDLQSAFKLLPAGQQAEVAAFMAKKAAQAATGQVATPAPLIDVSADEVEYGLKLIDHLGAGLLNLAKQLGVEANVFVQSPVGMVSMGLLVYHVAGAAILKLTIGSAWFFLTMPLLVGFFFKAVIPITGYADVTMSPWWLKGEVKRSRPIRKQLTFNFNGCAATWVFVICLAVQIIATLCILL
jgi:hypothetical protein